MGWWNTSKNQPADPATDATATAPEVATPSPSPSPQKPAERKTATVHSTAEKKLDNLIENISEGHTADSTESNIRYAAYTNRIRTVLSSAHRYVAYTSDIGESFRPVAHPNLVRAAYGVSWLYILGDVSYEGYRAYLQNQRTLQPAKLIAEDAKDTKQVGAPATLPSDVIPGIITPLQDYRTVMVQRAVFQSLASMGLPAFTIHSVVKYSGKAMKDLKNQRIRTWGPIGLGLGIVPFLPAIFDEPVENAVEWIFHQGFKAYGGPEYVGKAPKTGREHLLGEKLGKEKEL